MHRHTQSHSAFVQSATVHLSLSLCLSFSLALCPSVLLSREIRRGSIHHLSTSLGTAQWRRGGKEWGEIGLVLSFSLSLSLSLSLSPSPSLPLSHTHANPLHHQQQLLAMTANCFSYAYLWYTTDWKVLSVSCLCAQSRVCVRVCVFVYACVRVCVCVRLWYVCVSVHELD